MEHKPDKKQRRRLRLPFSAVLAYLLLAAFALCGTTLSRYVGKTALGDAARVAYIKELVLEEDGDFTSPGQWIITPGADMTKKAAVHFYGSEMACYVFVKISTSGWTRTGEYSYLCRAEDTDALSWSVDDGWAFLCGDDGGAVYYCIVSANNEVVLDVVGDGGRIAVSKDLTRTGLAKIGSISVTIETTAVQYHGFPEGTEIKTEQQRALAVWDTVKTR